MMPAIQSSDRISRFEADMTRFISIIAIMLLALGAVRNAYADRTPVWLMYTDRPAEPGCCGLLSRELFRQAVLIAARDQLGLQTRDESLREWLDGPPTNQTLRPLVTGRSIAIEAWGAAQPTIWRQEIDIHTWGEDCLQLAAQMETRSRGEFVDAIRLTGRDGSANVAKPDAPAPPDAEAHLAELNELSQFDVLRKTHALIRSDGESLQRLGSLVRAYANLGQLTRFQWSVEHEVFAARSLLYAQRMVAANPGSDFALWHRAYARAVAGFQGAALDDLSSADAIKKTDAPAWVALLAPFCKYQTDKLEQLAGESPSSSGLATFLAFLTVERSESQAAIMNAANTAMTANPECLRVLDSMCDHTGPGMLNGLVQMTAPQTFSRSLGNRLGTMGLPQSIVDLIQSARRPGGNPAGRETVCHALIEQSAPANDSGEPSWAVLGRMIQEITFTQVRREADLIANQWGVDASDYVTQAQALIADHPFKDLIAVYGLEHQNDSAALIGALKSISYDRATLSAVPFYYLFMQNMPQSPDTARAVGDAIFSNCDNTAFDLECTIGLYHDQPTNVFIDHLLDELRRVSPDSPLLIARAIQDHWDPAAAATWEGRQGDNPLIAYALGEKYASLKQWSDAQRCFKRYVAASPDLRGYQALAYVYSQQHRTDAWLSTLQEFLSQTDYGLQHAQVQDQIAHYYMAKGDYNAALPYADDAATTAAAWALNCDAGVHAGAGDWSGAEALINNSIEHYSSDPYCWFAWCIRTGHGHRAAATEALREYLAANADKTDDEHLLDAAALNIFDKNYRQALSIFRRRMAQNPGPNSGLHIALLDDTLHDNESRDAALDRVLSLPNKGNVVVGLASVFRDAIQAGPTARPDSAAIEAILAKAVEDQPVTICYLTAWFLDNRGQTDAATSYFRRCLSLVHGYDYFDLVLAEDALRNRGLDPVALMRTGQPPREPVFEP
jgi:tetratricopeptide (TPR) repeat protein